MQNFYKIIICVSLSVIICGLTACGKMAAPEPIEGSNYPHSYPRV